MNKPKRGPNRPQEIPEMSISALERATGWTAQKLRTYFGGKHRVDEIIHRFMAEIKELKEDATQSSDDHELRLKAAKADLAEIERDAQKGILVSVDDRNEQEVRRVGLMRSRLLAMPDLLRVQAGITIEQAETIERACRHCLDALADEIEAMDGEEN